jgi:DNA modification methylase
MPKTETSSFGTSKRESHDSSAFYARSLFEAGSVADSDFRGRGLYTRLFAESGQDTPKALSEPELGEWVDQIYCHSSEDMSVIPDGTVALAFTSPPYNVGKDYDDDMSMQEYLGLIRRVAIEVYRVLRPGGRYVVNIANLGRKPYIPLHAYFYDVHIDVGFKPMGEIIWQKARGASGSCAWGSWRSAKAPRIRDVHEYLLVFAKPPYSRPDTGVSDISSDEFTESTLSIWEIAPESAKRVGHPAPFPIELAERVIRLYSYVSDVVLDPFVGSGSTCIAALATRRHYVGFDISPDYCRAASAVIEEIKAGGVVGDVRDIRRTPMARVKDECSELAVAFGMLGISDPLNLSDSQVAEYFVNTLPLAKYARFRNEFLSSQNASLYRKLHDVGKRLRESYAQFSTVSSLTWEGPRKQPSTTTASIDLIVANTPVSVKAGSNVVQNPSPHNLFISVPGGTAPQADSEHWYLFADRDGYQALYSLVREFGLNNLPSDVAEFESVASPDEREAVQDAIGRLDPDAKSAFYRLYLDMCYRVARKSADTFNMNLQASMRGRARGAVLEQIARQFFRMDAPTYVLGGIENSKEFAVVVPSLTDWKSSWRITGAVATPNLQRKQSVVNIAVEYQHKERKESLSARFHVEIRWSHGKFAQAPEAKLYKDFRWRDIEFLKPVWADVG